VVASYSKKSCKLKEDEVAYNRYTMKQLTKMLNNAYVLSQLLIDGVFAILEIKHAGFNKAIVFQDSKIQLELMICLEAWKSSL
jgi:hypothetical protein